MSEDRKPKPPTEKEPAQTVLNRFLKEQDILIGTDKPEIEHTPKGAMIIYPPKIIAVYSSQIAPPKANKSVN